MDGEESSMFRACKEDDDGKDGIIFEMVGVGFTFNIFRDCISPMNYRVGRVVADKL